MPRRVRPGRLCVSLCALCAALAAPAALAQADLKSFPNRPLRILVGFSAGSVVDISARIIGQKLYETWQQQVVVENRPSAGGIIAAQLAANANADGYTLLSVSASHAVAPAIYAKLPYDTLKDFAGITTTVSSPALLVVAPSLGPRSVKELIALAKAKPGQLNFSSGGIGSATHFSAELFKNLAAIDVQHVPYKGIPEALAETITGRVQFTLSPFAVALPMVKEGKVIALAVSTAKRSAVLPELPTIAEAGVPGYRWETWFGLLAPAKTPRPLIMKLNAEITRILDLPDVRARWLSLGTEPIPSTPQAFDKLVADEIAALTRLARIANVQPN
jgi:tripartite-type tricarboxylate transporter receptor subunit TctC